ncbi:hypothetical protein ABZX99_08160, partial [Streptomyces antibioticus]|uniref:hypothetical protein n=1 Tax=Streptomyces antibioticus TaxID=1890 RepID=UPI0033AFC987
MVADQEICRAEGRFPEFCFRGRENEARLGEWGEPGVYLPGSVSVPGIGVYGRHYAEFVGGQFGEGSSQDIGLRGTHDGVTAPGGRDDDQTLARQQAERPPEGLAEGGARVELVEAGVAGDVGDGQGRGATLGQAGELLGVGQHDRRRNEPPLMHQPLIGQPKSSRLPGSRLPGSRLPG